MSSSTNSRPKTKQTQRSKAAIIRPVNRRSGKQSFVRIDDAENVVRPNVRALQLEDYVAQIRDSENTTANQPKVAPLDLNIGTPKVAEKTTAATAAAITKNSVSEAEARSIVSDIAQQQQSASANLTHADHVNVLRAVAKLDAGYQWIANSNQQAATQTPETEQNVEAFGDHVANASSDNDASTAEASTAQTTTQPLSQDLVNSIATAIASVLTDLPENQLNAKIASEDVDQNQQPYVEEEILKLSPELPRPNYTLPVQANNLNRNSHKATSAKPAQPAATHTISLSAAAWDVPAFRWPVVTDQILSISQMMSAMTSNCESILSPFGKTIAVTAPTRGQGTSTMSMTLARAFASQNKRVLLIDGDIMQPTLSSSIGVGGISWYENKVAQQPIGECIVQGRASGVCVMPLCAPVANVEAYSAPIFELMESQVDKVRNEFDLIVIDAGPVWQIVDEISSNSHLVDAAMLVNQDMHSNGFPEARERLMDRGIFKFIAAQNAFARKAG